MKWVEVWKKRMRTYAAGRGYTCDACGAELFDYPTHRLCERCESSMRFNDERTCEKCGRKTLAEGICLSCKSRAPRFTRGFSPFVYRGESASFVNRIKSKNPTLALYFAEKMAEYLIANFEDIGNFTKESGNTLMVIPIPLTETRLRERGYNQAALLAERVCDVLKEKGFSAELYTEVLEKKRDTLQQKHMDYVSRMENVAGAYHIHDRKSCRGKTALLIDDILTTGATGSECASRLLSAGAERVIFLVGASSPERK